MWLFLSLLYFPWEEAWKKGRYSLLHITWNIKIGCLKLPTSNTCKYNKIFIIASLIEILFRRSFFQKKIIISFLIAFANYESWMTIYLCFLNILHSVYFCVPYYLIDYFVSRFVIIHFCCERFRKYDNYVTFGRIFVILRYST